MMTNSPCNLLDFHGIPPDFSRFSLGFARICFARHDGPNFMVFGELLRAFAAVALCDGLISWDFSGFYAFSRETYCMMAKLPWHVKDFHGHWTAFSGKIQDCIARIR